MDLRQGTLWMAPMAGVTDRPFRHLVREQGCNLTFTEMISSKAIQFENRQTWKMLDLETQPTGVQLFGADPQVMAAAAQVAQAQGAALIDINMGCPVPKVVAIGEGAALMRTPALAYSIVKAIVAAVSIPVTVKIRAGWDRQSVNAVEFAQGLAQAGARVIIVHGRTREQMYSGFADWDIIGQVVRAVSVPVMGNGDIWSGPDARAMLEQTSCRGVMLARGVLGNPWLFAEVAATLSGKTYQQPSIRERIELALRHLRMELEYREERTAVLFMRKHLAWYLKGMSGTAPLKRQIFTLTSPRQIEESLINFVRSTE